jgi:hypothetical protein
VQPHKELDNATGEHNGSKAAELPLQKSDDAFGADGAMEEGSTATTCSRGSREGDNDSDDVDTGGASFAVSDLLRWQAVAASEKLTDCHIKYTAADTDDIDSQGQKTPAETRQRAKTVGNLSSERPSSPLLPRQSTSWRDDASRLQKSDKRSSNFGKSKSFDDRDRRQPRREEKALEVSPTSWVAQQQAARELRKTQDVCAKTDKEVEREMKGILNKLTVEKFRPLYNQLIGCGIKTEAHVEILMKEVFEKATTQHHFIDMYAELCVELHKRFVETATAAKEGDGSGADGRGFKRILLNQCQLSFEQYLRADAKTAADEEAAQRHKGCMLGNLRFVGALLVKSMLASKVLIAVVEELLSDPNATSL